MRATHGATVARKLDDVPRLPHVGVDRAPLARPLRQEQVARLPRMQTARVLEDRLRRRRDEGDVHARVWRGARHEWVLVRGGGGREAQARQCWLARGQEDGKGVSNGVDGLEESEARVRGGGAGFALGAAGLWRCPLRVEQDGGRLLAIEEPAKAGSQRGGPAGEKGKRPLSGRISVLRRALILTLPDEILGQTEPGLEGWQRRAVRRANDRGRRGPSCLLLWRWA